MVVIGMKVLYVATVSSHIKSFHTMYLKWFKEQGWEVHIAASGNLKIPYSDKYFKISFNRNPINFNNIIAYKQLKNIIQEQKYDIIHCHTPTAGALTRIAANKLKKDNAKVIYTAHGFHFFKGASLKNWLLYYPIEAWLAKYTDVLITINNEDYNRANKSFKAKSIQYIPGVGLNIEQFSSLVVDKKEKRREINIPENAFLLLSVGELNKNKNHETVIKAIAKINDPNIYYIICGEGPLHKYLINLIDELGLGNNVKLLGRRNDVGEICKISDVFVFPSIREGLSVALMEAMVSELPIICSDIRGNKDLIDDNKGGYLVDPIDVNSYVKYIKLISETQKNISMARHNKKKIELYSDVNVMKKIEKIYLDK